MPLPVLRGSVGGLLCLVLLVSSSGGVMGFFTLRLNRSSSRIRSGGMESRSKTPPGVGVDPFAEKRVYEDAISDKLWIWFFSQQMAASAETSPPAEFGSYDGFVELSRLLMRGGPLKTKGAVLKVLRSLTFPGFSLLFKLMFPGKARWACEFNAAITPVFFSWLVGPAWVEKGEVINPVTGEREMWESTVRIERCRYLEAVACKGACACVCKLPTQEFFTNDLGLAVTMQPQFDNLSCLMTFGALPPPLSEDPVAREGCYAQCPTAQPRAAVCPRLPLGDQA